MNHTKEPWVIHRTGGCIVGGKFIEYTNGKAQSQIVHCTIGNEITSEERDANAARIVACVNALEGVEHPAAIKNLIEIARIGAQSFHPFAKQLSKALGELGVK